MLRQRGSLLFMAIMLTGLLSLLVLSQMQLILLHIKAVNQVIDRHKTLAELEQAAQRLLLRDRADCVQRGDDPNVSIARLKRQDGCLYHEQARSYRYRMEDLGVIPCLYSVVKGKKFGSHHWRLTIAAASGQLLQLRFAKTAAYLPCERHVESGIKTGILSWRSLG